MTSWKWVFSCLSDVKNGRANRGEEATTLLEQQNQEHISLLKDRVSALKTVCEDYGIHEIARCGYWQRSEEPEPFPRRDGSLSRVLLTA